jgi:hypothetical protein
MRPQPSRFGLPRYGFKAGGSGRAFPATPKRRVGRFASALPHFASVPRSVSGDALRGAPPFERLLPLYPRGPRSGPSYPVSVHLRLFGPTQLKPQRVSLFQGTQDTRESRIMCRIHVGEQECLHHRQGNTLAQARRVTNLPSLNLRLPNEREPWCIWDELGVSRHFHVNSRGSPSDP